MHRRSRDRPGGGARRARPDAPAHVKAYVGGSDFWGTAALGEGRPRRRRLLRARHRAAGRPGSTFKPFVLAAALDAGRPAHPELHRARRRSPSRSRAARRRGSSTTTTAAAAAAMNLIEATVQLGQHGLRAARDGPRRRSRWSTWPKKMGIRSPPSPGPVGRAREQRRDRRSTWRPPTTRSPATASTPTPVLVTRVTTSDGTVLYQAPHHAGTRVLSGDHRAHGQRRAAAGRQPRHRA